MYYLFDDVKSVYETNVIACKNALVSGTYLLLKNRKPSSDGGSGVWAVLHLHRFFFFFREGRPLLPQSHLFFRSNLFVRFCADFHSLRFSAYAGFFVGSSGHEYNYNNNNNLIALQRTAAFGSAAYVDATRVRHCQLVTRIALLISPSAGNLDKSLFCLFPASAVVCCTRLFATDGSLGCFYFFFLVLFHKVFSYAVSGIPGSLQCPARLQKKKKKRVEIITFFWIAWSFLHGASFLVTEIWILYDSPSMSCCGIVAKQWAYFISIIFNETETEWQRIRKLRFYFEMYKWKYYR